MMITNPTFEEFEGYTHKQKTIDEIYKYIQEDRMAKQGYLNKYLPLSLMTAFNPETDEITDVGCSVPDDIVNDNFGEWLAGILSNSGVGATKPGLDISNTSQTILTYGPSTSGVDPAVYSRTGGSIYETTIQVGKGFSMAPTRQDFTIETPFTDGGPEDFRQVANPGSYISGNNTVQVGVIISPTNAAGTVRESCLFQEWRILGIVNVSQPFLMSRDFVTINFLSGQSISVSYIWNI